MNVLRIFGRIIVGFLTVTAALQTILSALGVVAVLKSSAAGTDATSGAIGYFAGSFMMLALFLWLFRKLGKKASANPV
jgi:hypothetical protein